MNWLLVENSLFVGGASTLLATALGVMAALFLAGLPRAGRKLLLILSIVALALPPFLATNCWLDLLGAAGKWRGWLPFNIMSLGGTIWLLALLLWPITSLVVSSAWRRLEPAQLEVDPLLRGSVMIRVLLIPLARGALIQSAVITFVLALNNFAVPAILQVKVLPAEMWIRFATAFDSVGVLRMSWPLVLAPLLLVIWLTRREFPWPHLATPVSARLFRRQLGWGWFYGSAACTFALCLLSVMLPLWQLAAARRTWTELHGAIAAGQSAIWNSFWFAAAAAALLIAVSLFFATIIGFRGWSTAGCARPRAQQCSSTSARFESEARTQYRSLHPRAGALRGSLLWLPFLLPGVLIGIALIWIFNRPSTALLYQSATIVILAFAIRYVGFAGNAVAHALKTVDCALVDVARLEGATRWQMLRYAQWPQIKAQLAAVWYIVFLLCLWDVESMILVYPPGGETLALRIFNLLHYGHNAQVNALCLTLLGVALLPLLLWFVGSSLLRRVRRRECTLHAPRSTLHVFFLILCVIPCFCACSPSTSHIESTLFDHIEIIGTRGVGIGQLNKPRSVAVDRQDNLYVVDMTGRVQKFSPAGQFQLLWQMPQTDLGKPKGMGRDREGNIIVIEPHYQRVNYFSPDGKLLGQWGEKGTNAGQLIMPRAVAVNSRGETFISEYGAVERVQKFSLETAKAVADGSPAINTRLKPGVNESGATFASLGSGTNLILHPHLLAVLGHAGTGPGEFNRPEGLCVDSQDRLYVADSCNHRIQVFSSDGKFLRLYGRPGKGKGEFSYPYDICVDAAGRQYVCEFGNSRIQVFDANNQPIEIIGGPGAEPGQFSNPWSVALDSAGNLYVADSQNHRVQKLARKKPDY